ncbi:MAG TPA: SDR family oxidoreductase [Gammaproteobacteria bacterium]|nr:SDR family oxidoreductase [Gammaproteobacteria bacterium]
MTGLDSFNLRGKIALITGGAGLLGIEHTAALLECGARVVITDINSQALQSARDKLAADWGDERVFVEEMDVTGPESIKNTMKKLEVSLGGVHILINNAAIDPKVKTGEGLKEASRFEHFSLEQWHFQLNVGLTGAFLCSQIFGSWMAEHDGGVILNIASDLSVFAPDQRLYRKEGVPEDQQPVKPVTYSVIKTGLIGLTRYLATYWADKNVRANAISPGGIYTGQPEAFVTRLCQLIPMGRMAKHDEYHAAVQFLCSDASAYMNGQNIVMDGGRSVL